MTTDATPILALDQGTSSSRALVFMMGGDAAPPLTARAGVAPLYPRDGWVEQDPEAIWESTCASAREALAQHDAPIAALGLTNQRETTLIWERATGKPIYNAIVWQDRRTADICARLRKGGHEELVSERTGLLLDPYFSATKIAWILDNVSGARARAKRGELAFGTVDTFLIWRLTGGRVHATDATNAARTMLFDIRRGCWDDALLAMFDIPRALLPELRDSAADFGAAEGLLDGRTIPIRGVVGDQQAAAIGQSCTSPGMAKITYGTGAFLLLNTGTICPTPPNKLLATIAWRLNGRAAYALEGSIFTAGAVVQWLRDALGLFATAEETEDLARRADPQSGVVVVPAFTGLGAPYWDPHARGAIVGLTRNTGTAEIVRAALESVVFQTCDLLNAMDTEKKMTGLRVDGGMSANGWLMQNLADMTGLVIERPAHVETTALGAAMLAALGIGVYAAIDEAAASWRPEARFTPSMESSEREARLALWHAAVGRIRS